MFRHILSLIRPMNKAGTYPATGEKQECTWVAYKWLTQTVNSYMSYLKWLIGLPFMFLVYGRK